MGCRGNCPAEYIASLRDAIGNPHDRGAGELLLQSDFLLLQSIYNFLMLPALIGLTAAAAASAAGYQSMAPTGQWYGRTFTGFGRGSKQIALTYDDGPNDPH